MISICHSFNNTIINPLYSLFPPREINGALPRSPINIQLIFSYAIQEDKSVKLCNIIITENTRSFCQACIAGAQVCA